jgi:hypothetical protein
MGAPHSSYFTCTMRIDDNVDIQLNLLTLCSIVFLCHSASQSIYIFFNLNEGTAGAKITASLLMHNVPSKGIEGIQHNMHCRKWQRF